MDDPPSPHHEGDTCQSGSNRNTNILGPIPTEIIENIIEYLDVSSILNLRLTCRDLAKRSVGPRLLKTTFQRRTTDLSSARLSLAEEVISSPVFGPAVKHFTVQAIVYYADWVDKMEMGRAALGTSLDDNMAKFHERLSWLADRRAEQALSEWDEHQEAISRLAGIMKHLRGRDAGRPTLEGGLGLVGGVSPGPGIMYNPARSGPAIWSNVARRASQAFYVTVKAMARSGLKTPLFWVFHQTHRCSIPAGTVSWLLQSMDKQDLAYAMSGIKNFALSFAPVIGTKAHFGLQPAEEGEKNNGQGFQEGSDDSGAFPNPEEEIALKEEAFVAVPKFIGLVSADVEILDLHMFNPYKRRSPEYSHIFANLAQDVHFLKLKDCVLRGIWATTESLLQFLDKHGSQFQRLKLRDIWLTEGTWAPIFHRLNAKTLPNLEFLRLENLFYGDSRLVNLSPRETERMGVDISGEIVRFEVNLPKNCHFSCMAGKCVFLREWGREQFFLESRNALGVPVGLEFTDEDRGMLIPSPEFRDWKMYRGDEFGPPPEAKEWEEHLVAMGRPAHLSNRG